MIASVGAHTQGKLLASALVAELRESDRFKVALNGSRFRSLWPHIARAAATDELNVNELVRVLCASQSFVEELESEGFAEDQMGMYEAVVTAHPDHGKAGLLAAWVAESLSNLTLAQWQAAVAESDEWVALLGAGHNAAPNARIRGAYAHALARFLEQVAEGREVTSHEVEQWSRSVVPLLAPAVAGAYAEGIAQGAANAGGGLPQGFLDLVGDTLKEPRIFMRPNIRDGLVPNLVIERNAAGLSWLIDALHDAETARNSPPDAFDALAEVVRTSLGHDEDTDKQLRQIAALIGLDLEEPQTDP